MSYIGYINVSQTIEQTPQIIRLMKSHGCGNIHIGQSRDKERIEWCRFIDSLSNGDSAVFASFDNVFNNFHDMMFFIKYCSKMDIRIISLSDGLDTTEYCTNITSRWNTPPCREPPTRFAINPSDEIFSLTSWDAWQRFFGVFLAIRVGNSEVLRVARPNVQTK